MSASRGDDGDGSDGSGRREALFDEAFLKKLEVLAIVSRKVFGGRIRAERRSKKTGAGVEFADHRDYVPGDDLRYLDWGVYGRLGRLLVRLFEEEEDLHIYLLLDVSPSMTSGRPRKIDYARQVVAALAYVGLANLDRVALQPFSSDLGERMPPARGRGRIFKVFDFLRALEPPAPDLHERPTTDDQATTDLHRSLESFVHQSRRRGLAVVVSDFFDPRGFEDGLNLLRYHRFEPFVIQIVDEADAHPQLVGDVELIDCETGELRELTVSPSVLAEVARAHAALCDGLAAWCASHGVSHVRADTDVPFEELLLQVFRQGGLVA